MSGKKKLSGPSDKSLRELLIRYQCPTPFHAVRTRFLGQIASPKISVSPMKAVQDLWGGKMPEFEDEASVRGLIEGLVNGLWNRLTQHQSQRHPFHLTRMSPPVDALTFARYTRVRCEELDGFVDGLFGDDTAMDLPETAHQAMTVLGDVRDFMGGMSRFSGDDDLQDDIEVTSKQLVELSRIAEHELSALLISCVKARRDALDREQFH